MSHWGFGESTRKYAPLAIVGMVIGGTALAALFAFLFGWVVMLLWNWLMPVIFGLPRIGYWQGWGLVLLSHILIKPGYPSGGHDGSKARKPRDEWKAEAKARFAHDCKQGDEGSGASEEASRQAPDEGPAGDETP
ncbi:MAG: hypothetical protein CVV47_10445 [Spirochaetae bacterium HGW-Spirochaetae-3]|jgi:hypothetical protein|nr:MAG: hypothetical protein CVV47_10445 [Spirochaetae bacterium HGW-Spirochaetae-3]